MIVEQKHMLIRRIEHTAHMEDGSQRERSF
jgi:hypothetical protein